MDINSENKNVHAGHRKRVKANVCKNGFSQMEDHKLLELILFYAIPQADTNELAHNVLSELGSMDEVFKADIDRLLRIKGVGENTAVLLASMGEAMRRASKQKHGNKVKYTNPDDFSKLALSQLSGESVEKVYIFCMDLAGKLKRVAMLSKGTEGASLFDLRGAVQTAMDCNASKAFIAHNHPVGEAYPSGADVDATRTTSLTFRKLGIFLVDHIIIGENDSTYSMYNDVKYRGLFY